MAHAFDAPRIDYAGRSEHPAARRVDQDLFTVAGGTDRAIGSENARIVMIDGG